jgi:hypothetical protein
MREADYLARELADAKAALHLAVRSTVADHRITAALARHPLGLLGVVALGACWLTRRRGWFTRAIAPSLRLAKSTAWRAVLPVLLEGWTAIRKSERRS